MAKWNRMMETNPLEYCNPKERENLTIFHTATQGAIKKYSNSIEFFSKVQNSI